MQAARGASLSARGWLTAFLVSDAVLLADQLSKAWALSALEPGERTELIPGLIELTLHRNAGAALGTGGSYTIVLTAVAIVVSLAVVVLARRLNDRLWAVGFGLLLGGALGNLADRLFRDPGIFRGHVVDFIDYAGLFIGNVADIALTAAAIVMILQSMRGVGLDGSRK